LCVCLFGLVVVVVGRPYLVSYRLLVVVFAVMMRSNTERVGFVCKFEYGVGPSELFILPTCLYISKVANSRP